MLARWVPGEPVRNYDGIIFNLDGTLWDGAETAARGWGLALESCGIRDFEIGADDIRSVAGQPFEVCVQTLFPGLPASSSVEFLRALDAGERADFRARGGRIFEGVARGVEMLFRDYKLFLVGNCQDWYLDCFWRQSGLRRFFPGGIATAHRGCPRPRWSSASPADTCSRRRYTSATPGRRGGRQDSGRGFRLRVLRFRPDGAPGADVPVIHGAGRLVRRDRRPRTDSQEDGGVAE